MLYFSPSRDLSRLLLIPFNLPKIGGTSEEDCVNFQKLGNLKKLASSCIGWAISLGKKFEERGVSEINTTMLPMIYPQLKGLDPRFITGYSILLYFVKEVSIQHANQNYVLTLIIELGDCTLHVTLSR